MKQRKQIGWVLLFLAFLIIVGFVVRDNYYWFVLDTILILTLTSCGLVLLLKKQ